MYIETATFFNSFVIVSNLFIIIPVIFFLYSCELMTTIIFVPCTSSPRSKEGNVRQDTKLFHFYPQFYQTTSQLSEQE